MLDLTNKWFHSCVNEKIEWQGHIIGKVKEGVYLVQLFSWIDGSPTNQAFTKMEDMIDWQLYDTNEDMNEAAERFERSH